MAKAKERQRLGVMFNILMGRLGFLGEAVIATMAVLCAAYAQGMNKFEHYDGRIQHSILRCSVPRKTGMAV